MKLKALTTFIFWNYAVTASSKLICFGTDGHFGHVGMGFEMEDGSQVYYEALAGKGIVGPRTWYDQLAFIRADSRRYVARETVSTDVTFSTAKRALCDSYVGSLSYSVPQLATMALFERYRIPMFRTKTRVVCSEFVSMVLCPEIDLRDRRRPRHDMVNPNSCWRRWLEIKTGNGAISAPQD